VPEGLRRRVRGGARVRGGGGGGVAAARRLRREEQGRRRRGVPCARTHRQKVLRRGLGHTAHGQAHLDLGCETGGRAG
jgi:hypothetical protein